MNGGDTEMGEAETTASNSNEIVRNLLTQARQLVDQGKPSQALQVVVAAMKARSGNEAVFQTLNHAKDMYINKIQTTSAADELASLLAECAIAEANPSQPGPYKMDIQLTNKPDVQGTSILSETGRKQIVLDASSDGSNFICLQCGGFVSNYRKDEHFAFWCCKT